MKVVLFLSLFLSTELFANTITGRWITYDDQSNQANSVINIQFNDRYFTGTIVELINPSVSDPVCERCMAPLKNQPIIGLEIFSKLSKDKKKYKGGKILDPSNGKYYSLIIEHTDRNTLHVTGYVGFSFLGRTQIWRRQTPLTK